MTVQKNIEKIKENIFLVSNFDDTLKNPLVYLLIVLVAFALLYTFGLVISVEDIPVEKKFIIPFYVSAIIAVITFFYSLFVYTSIRLLNAKNSANFKKILEISIYSLTPVIPIGILLGIAGFLDYIVPEEHPAFNLAFTVFNLVLDALVILMFVNVFRGIKKIYKLSTLRSILATIIVPPILGLIVLAILSFVVGFIITLIF
ncbi:MAG TPA: YIP1 family protein [Candidatus Bilamarchaeaceae archaeon]|nr:YIP1 family protein [Candidatus Bilamarchaeaceae archaeon]